MYLLEGRQWACLYHLRLLTVLSTYNRVRKRHACVVWRVSKEPTGRSMGRCSRLLRSQCDVCWLRLRALAGRCSPSAKRSICFVSGRNARGGGGPQTHITDSVHLPVCLFISLCIILSTPLQSLHFAPAYILHNTAKYIRIRIRSHTAYKYTITRQPTDAVLFFTAQGKATKDHPSFSCLKDRGAFLLQATQRILYSGVGERGERGRRGRAKGDAEKARGRSKKRLARVSFPR